MQKKYGNTKRNQTMQHRGEDHSKTNGNRIYLCHSCSDLHLIRKNGRTHDLGTNHDNDKTSNLGHRSHTNLNVRKRIAHKTIGLILCSRSHPNRRWAQHTIFLNQTSPLQNFQSCHSCVAQIVFLPPTDNPTRVRPLLDTLPSKQHRTIGTATTNQLFNLIKNNLL